MRINNLYGEMDKAAVENTSKPTSPAPASTSGASAGAGASQVGEKVTLSAQAQELAAKAAANADDAKVQKLTASLQNGTFKIDAHAIANRIVDGG
jgi:negative regulator of flagellin synthesis FlgM